MRRVWALSAAYAGIFFILGADRYLTHRSVEDLGIFVQSIATAGHGFTNTIESQSHFAVHFSPILYLLAPLLWLGHSPLVLIATQALAGALVAPPLALIARRRVSANFAVAIAAIALLYPPLGGVTFTEFHENGLVPAGTAWLLYALDARKWGAAVALAAVTLGMKEDQSVFVGLTGLFAGVAGLRLRNSRAALVGFVIAALAVGTVPLYFAVVRPLTGATGPWHPLVFLHTVSPDAQVGILRAASDRLGYLLLALLPLLFLPLRSPAAILALPGFAETLVSHAPVTYTMGQHYAAVWVPYVLVAFADALRTIGAVHPRLASRLLRTCAVLCAAIYFVANPLHPGHFLGWYDARDARLDRFLATLPAQMDVGTQEEIYTHLGFDRRATLGIECLPAYALFDFDYPHSNWVVRDGPLLRRLVARDTYRLMRKDGDIELYERHGPVAPSAASGNPGGYEFRHC